MKLSADEVSRDGEGDAWMEVLNEMSISAEESPRQMDYEVTQKLITVGYQSVKQRERRTTSPREESSEEDWFKLLQDLCARDALCTNLSEQEYLRRRIVVAYLSVTPREEKASNASEIETCWKVVEDFCREMLSTPLNKKERDTMKCASHIPSSKMMVRFEDLTLEERILVVLHEADELLTANTISKRVGFLPPNNQAYRVAGPLCILVKEGKVEKYMYGAKPMYKLLYK